MIISKQTVIMIGIVLVGFVLGFVGYFYLSSGQLPLIAGVDGGMDTLSGGTGTNYGTFGGNNGNAGYTVKEGKKETVNTGKTKAQLKAQCDADGASWDVDRSACLYPSGTGPLNPPSAICGGYYWEDSKKAYSERSVNNPCNGDRCELTPAMVSAGCVIQDVRCRGGGNVGSPCNENIVYEGKNSVSVQKELKCGSQQIDIVCASTCGNTKPIAFSNKITGINCKEESSKEPSPKPSPSPSPVVSMACTGLTSTPATDPAPVIGSKLTFTCAGVVTPSSAGTLSYKFRYSINSGTVTTLANKTTTTAELSIAACGTYKVECQACATLNGVVTCDPIWTGATQ